MSKCDPSSEQQLRAGDKVTIDTDTLFDAEGVPVSIRKGANGRIWELNSERWAQVLVWWEEEGQGVPELLGVDIKHLVFHSHLNGCDP